MPAANFTFTELQIERLKIGLGKRILDDKKTTLINATEKSINAWLSFETQFKPLRSAETKTKLLEIEKAAIELMRVMEKMPPDIARNFPNSWYQDKTFEAFELADMTRKVINNIGPSTNNNSSKRQLLAWIKENYEAILEKPAGKGKGTPFNIFQETVFQIIE